MSGDFSTVLGGMVGEGSSRLILPRTERSPKFLGPPLLVASDPHSWDERAFRGNSAVIGARAPWCLRKKRDTHGENSTTPTALPFATICTGPARTAPSPAKQPDHRLRGRNENQENHG